jgi:electron transfer flavoprotein alpha subunit
MSGVLVIGEQTAGVWNRMSLETLVAGQHLARTLAAPAAAVVFGPGSAEPAKELAACALDRVVVLEHERLANYTADGATAALAWLVAQVRPDVVLLPHTYRVRDFAPRLAARAGRPLLSDVTGFRVEQGELIFERQLFQGRLAADYSVEGAGPVFASLQAGAFRTDGLEHGSAPVEILRPPLDACAIRQSAEEPFRASVREVDLAAAERIVAVGRGIRELANIELVRALAAALGAELAASRPICDNGWLPMERQIGSSGQTVAPKLYIAIGISGAIQHQVGMKGARTIVAINKDAGAPIFEIADYGILGDLFEVVPALTEELRRASS